MLGVIEFADDVFIVGDVVVVVVVVVDETKQLNDEFGVKPETDTKPLVPKFVVLNKTGLFVLVMSLFELLCRPGVLLVANGTLA